MKNILFLFTFLTGQIVFGAYSSAYKLKFTTEDQISNCLYTLNDIVDNVNVIMLTKGGFAKITEISMDVSKDNRTVSCRYEYTGKGVLNQGDGKIEQITFKGKTFGNCIKGMEEK